MQILKKKMKEYFHRTHMPPLLAKVNRGITPEDTIGYICPHF
jgi:hypothetical protein